MYFMDNLNWMPLYLINDFNAKLNYFMSLLNYVIVTAFRLASINKGRSVCDKKNQWFINELHSLKDKC